MSTATHSNPTSTVCNYYQSSNLHRDTATAEARTTGFLGTNNSSSQHRLNYSCEQHTLPVDWRRLDETRSLHFESNLKKDIQEPRALSRSLTERSSRQLHNTCMLDGRVRHRSQCCGWSDIGSNYRRTARRHTSKLRSPNLHTSMCRCTTRNDPRRIQGLKTRSRKAWRW